MGKNNLREKILQDPTFKILAIFGAIIAACSITFTIIQAIYQAQIDFLKLRIEILEKKIA